MGGFNVFGSLGFLAGIVGGATLATRSFGLAFLAVGLAEMLIALFALPILLGVDLPDPAETTERS
jgi:hypothetical protein